MGKLIDADKILNDLNEHIGSLNNDLEYAIKEGEENWASEISNKIELLSLFVDGIASGRYKADPIPLPTIKQGDEVLIVKGPFAGSKVFVCANHAHKRNISAKIDGELWNIHYDDLEVSHD